MSISPSVQSRSSLRIASVAALLRNDRCLGDRLERDVKVRAHADDGRWTVGEWRMEGWKAEAFARWPEVVSPEQNCLEPRRNEYLV
jgi:hypothetical protein